MLIIISFIPIIYITIIINCIEGGLHLIYNEGIRHFEKLRDLLVFQERRNFFNKIEDMHLNASINIIETILNKSKECEFSYSDLAEIVTITTRIIDMLNVSDDVKKHIQEMNLYSLRLKVADFNLKLCFN